MVEINEKIEASLMIASYLETIGFKNTEWEFNYKYTVNTSSLYLKIWTYLLHHYMILGGSNIDITGWDASDDTILILATAKACSYGGSEEKYKEQYLYYLDILKDKKRVPGVTTIESLSFLKYNDSSKLKINSNMGGNGAAMRTGPIGLYWYKDIEKVIEESLIASRLTHNYYIGFLGGMVTALFTAFAMNNIKPWEWCDKLIELYKNKIIQKYYSSEELDDYIRYWEKYRKSY